MVAGIVLSLAEAHRLGETMPLGIAAGAATLMSRGIAAWRREDLERLCPHLMTSPGWLLLGKAAGS